MKKILVGVAAIAVLLFVGCKADNTLYLYNWTYYAPESVLRSFEKEYNCTVVYDTYASNEELYAKLLAGGSGYDLVVPSGDYVSIMMHQGMLEKIDHSKLQNLGNIDPGVLKKATYDPSMEYSVPYYFGAAGVAVNTARVPTYEKSWSIFGRRDLAGKMTMMDDMREVFGDALVHLGYSVNTGNLAQLEAARLLVKDQWQPNLVKFDAEAFGKGFADEDFWVVQGYAEVVYEELPEGREGSTVFFIPPEGGPGYIDSLCILKGAKHQDLAYKFIDYIHRPENYVQFLMYFGFPSTVNVPARQLLASDYPDYKPYYTAEELENVELKNDLGANLEMYDEAWLTIRVGD
ncbi:MAG: extracellular solute-binding protein [Spirochaetaceae bacterium]|jgi:spermidine/putrescine transport system substrate-binding protein|nr:extracellular solute-binding protein [Spirochaetaceae bacterium]